MFQENLRTFPDFESAAGVLVRHTSGGYFGYITNWRRAWSPVGSQVSPSAAPFHCSLRRSHGRPGCGAVTRPLTSSGHWRAGHLTVTPLMNVTHWMVFNVTRWHSTGKTFKTYTNSHETLQIPRKTAVSEHPHAHGDGRAHDCAHGTAQLALTNRRESGVTMATENKALLLVHFSRPCRDKVCEGSSIKRKMQHCSEVAIEVPEGEGARGFCFPDNGITFLTIKGISHLRKMQYIFTIVL